MCLDVVKRRYKREVKEMWAYKRFYDHDTETPMLIYRSIAGDEVCERGKWYTAEEHLIGRKLYRGDGIWELDPSRTYTSGFHCYLKPGYERIRVKVRGVHTVGMQDGEAVIVARQMYVPKLRKARARKARREK